MDTIRRWLSGSADDDEQAGARVKDLADRAFDLAKARYHGDEAPAEEQAEEIRELQTELRGLAARLREEQPAVYRRRADLISEALLDFKYALEAPEATSLRLHHYIEGQEAAR